MLLHPVSQTLNPSSRVSVSMVRLGDSNCPKELYGSVSPLKHGYLIAFSSKISLISRPPIKPWTTGGSIRLSHRGPSSEERTTSVRDL